MPRSKLTSSNLRRIRRRLDAGESLREIGRDYGVAHTTVRRALDAEDAARARLLARREQLRAQREQARAQRKQARRAREHVTVATVASTFDEEATEPPPSEDASVRRSSRGGLRRLPREFDIVDWLNESDARLPLTRDDLPRPADRTAEAAVASGGGIDAIIKATGLCTRENVLAIIHPEIIRRAEQNDAVTSPLDAS